MQVASEDTVLCAVRWCVDKASPRKQPAVKTALVPLIRCQHLSMYWLSSCVLSYDCNLFDSVSRQVKSLLMARQTDEHFKPLQPDLADGELMAEAPVSWLLGPRACSPVSSVKLVWAVSVSQLRELVQKSVRCQADMELNCSSCSAPLGGCPGPCGSVPTGQHQTRVPHWAGTARLRMPQQMLGTSALVFLQLLAMHSN